MAQEQIEKKTGNGISTNEMANTAEKAKNAMENKVIIRFNAPYSEIKQMDLLFYEIISELNEIRTEHVLKVNGMKVIGVKEEELYKARELFEKIEASITNITSAKLMITDGRLTVPNGNGKPEIWIENKTQHAVIECIGNFCSAVAYLESEEATHDTEALKKLARIKKYLENIDYE